MVNKKSQTRGRPRKYDWDEWFGRRSFRLIRGEDYDVSQTAMAQQIRNRAVRLRKKVQIIDTGDGFSVAVWDEQEEPVVQVG